jgi:hypothetical protein
MIFKRLFSRRASESAPVTKPSLWAGGARNPRLDVCHRSTDLAELWRLAEEDEDAGVREVAQARYRHLLCGEETPPTLDLHHRLAVIAELDEAHPQEQRILTAVATEAREPEMRIAALARLTAQDFLAARVLGDAATQVRVAAAERLRERPALEQVARHIGKKDKRVYRLVNARLKELAEEEARPARIHAQCEELCAQLETLGRFENWGQDRARFELIERQWTALADQVAPEGRARFEREKERFQAAYAAHLQAQAQAHAKADAQAQIQARLADTRELQEDAASEETEDAERNALITDLQAAARLDDAARLAETLEAIATRWTALSPAPQPLRVRYQATRQAAQSRLEALIGERQASDRLTHWLAEARATLDQSAPLSLPILEKLLRQVRALPPLTGPDQELLAAVIDARGQLEERQQRQLHHLDQRLKQATEKLVELEAALTEGELRHAEPLFQSIQAAVEAADQAGHLSSQTQSLKGRLRALSPRLRELQQWRRWGADTHRESLCQAMESLVTLDLPLPAKVERLKSLRTEWKALQQDGAPANQPLWARFQIAADQVYALCQPWLEQRKREREAAHAAREAVCQQLEAFLDQVDWTRVDWRQAQRAEREMRTGWEQLGEAEPRQARALERRFRTALKRLDDRLAAERADNQRLKEDLIARVRALVDAPDLAAAIEETKRLQSQWHTTVAARQRDENRLWQDFRAGCDAVFARRRQRYEAQAAELEGNRQHREDLLAEAEALAGNLARGETPWPADLPGLLSDLAARWRESVHLPVPRPAGPDLERRWQQLQERFRTLGHEHQARQRRQTLDLLARQAQMCADLENHTASGLADPQVLASAEAAWATFPTHADPTLQAAITHRFAQARAWFAAGAIGLPRREREAEAAANARARAELCLGLEILAQIDSPPACAQERLALQVNRLQEHLVAGERDPLAEASRLLERWYLIGPLPAEGQTELEPRFQRVLDALLAATPHSETGTETRTETGTGTRTGTGTNRTARPEAELEAPGGQPR